MNLKQYLEKADIQEIEALMKEIKTNDIRSTAISTLLSGDAEVRDNKGIVRSDNDYLVARSWIIATLLHLKFKGYEVVKK